MKKLQLFSSVAVFAVALFLIQGCNVSTANMSSLETFSDKEGKNKTTSFKAGDTIYAKATISNNPGKVKVKYSLMDPSGKAMNGADVSVDIEGDGFASYSLPTTPAMPAGSYKLNADMLNDAGEKKDSKSATLTVAAGTAAPAAPATTSDAPKAEDKDDEDK